MVAGDILDGMRQIGSVTTEPYAQRLTDYLLTRGVKSQYERVEGAWSVWVYDEDQVTQAREIVAAFQANPERPEYLEAEAAARKLRDAAIAGQRRVRKNIVDVRSQWTRPSPNRPVTMFLIAVCVLVAFMSRFGDDPGEDKIIQKLLISSYEQRGTTIYWWRLSSPESDLRKGELWRVITPIFVHFGVMHLFMNMMALHSLGGLIEMVRGSWRLTFMMLFLAATSNLLQYWWDGSPSFGGISGVVFGLFGYVWMKSRFQPELGMRIDPTSITMVLFFLVLCMTGLIGPIANAAHLAGLVGGVLIGIAPVGWRTVFGRRRNPNL